MLPRVFSSDPKTQKTGLTVRTIVSTCVCMSQDDQNPISQFHKDAARAPDPSSRAAGRSAADEVIEQVGDFPQAKKRNPNACPGCGGVDIRTKRPLGGAPRSQCRACGHKWLGAPRSPAKLVLAKNGPTQTSVKGPYYRGTALLPDRDKHAPKSRTKAKSLSALKDKLK